MRYRISESGTMVPVESSADVVTATVVFTLAVGIVFLFLGVRGKQNWLKFWGGLTCLCCAVYFMRGLFGLAWLD